MASIVRVRDKEGKVHAICAVAVPGIAAPHADKHKAGGSDALKPEDIGAARMETGTFNWTSEGVTLSFDSLPKFVFVFCAGEGMFFYVSPAQEMVMDNWGGVCEMTVVGNSITIHYDFGGVEVVPASYVAWF